MTCDRCSDDALAATLEALILRRLTTELSNMFPNLRVAPLPPLRGAGDSTADEYGLSSEEEALRLYMAVVADVHIFSCLTGGWVIPEPLYGLAKKQVGVHVEDFLCAGSFHIGIAWVDCGRSVFEPALREFLKKNWSASCKR